MFQCFIEENNGIMDKRCIRKFKELLPGSQERKMELVSVIMRKAGDSKQGMFFIFVNYRVNKMHMDYLVCLIVCLFVCLFA